MSRLPAQYDEKAKAESLPESPFVGMNSSQVCVKSEGFKYKGSIIVPKTSERPSTAGRVVDAGPDCLVAGRQLVRGERILYSQFAGYLFNFKGASGMRVMGNSEVLGRLKEEVEIDDES